MSKRSSKSKIGPSLSSSPSTGWAIQDLCQPPGKPDVPDVQIHPPRGRALPPLKITPAPPMTPISEAEVASNAAIINFSGDCMVTSSLEVTEGIEEVDSDVKGKRFLKNRFSWIKESKSAAMSPKGGEEGLTLLSYLEYLSFITTEDIDFDILEKLLESGEDVNAVSEATGQSILHEVAASWDKSVAEFFLQKGANIHLQDHDGKTPLHVASSTDHEEMVEWLIENGAELQSRTFIEKQTPLHYAARYDSLQAMEILLQKGCDCEVRDYKGRTPLHLAAQLDRTAAAEYLITVPISAEVRVQDNTGNHAIASMIQTMPRVAFLALDQLHRIASAKRKQYFLLNHLEPEPGSRGNRGVKTPFEVAVENKRHTILSHTVMQTLIAEKWRFVRWFFYGHLTLYFIFLLSWSLLIAYPSVQEKHVYAFPTDTWRIFAEVLAVATYVFQLVEEVFELVFSKLKYKYYKQLQAKIIQDDLKNLPSQQKEEKEFLESELKRLNKSTSNYFKDPWNIIDIIAYVMIFLLILLHISDIIIHNVNLALWVARVSCFVLILIWVRLFKHARGFRSLGPLVTIVYQLLGDILRYFTLYAIVFVPYVLCFWVLFGGEQSQSLPSTDNQDLTVFYRVAISMFRMSLIDEYPYSSFRAIDEAMAAILVITFLLFLAVIGLNLFIALLSDTFQRVYDNAQAIAILQQADLILSYEEKMCSCLTERYRAHIHNKCNPKSEFYDDDDINSESAKEVKKVAHQIHDIVTELQLNNLKQKEDQIAEFIERQDEKLDVITGRLDEMKTLMLEKNQTKKSKSSPEHPTATTLPRKTRQPARQEAKPPHPLRQKSKQRKKKESQQPQISPTKPTLNKIYQISNQKQHKMRQAAALSNLRKSALARARSAIATPTLGQPFPSYFSIPGQSDTAISAATGLLPTMQLASAPVSSFPQSSVTPALVSQFSTPSRDQTLMTPTPPVALGHQQSFFSQVSIPGGIPRYGSQYSRTDSIPYQYGHRRMKKFDLENLQWEKKSQPARKQ